MNTISHNQLILSDGQTYGGKATNLLRILKKGFQVPRFWVIPAEYFTSRPSDLETILEPVFITLSDTDLVSVRSSAVGEDGSEHSFAGLFETLLNVNKQELPNAIEQVYQSGFSKRVEAYKSSKGIPTNIRMAVIIQVMINADSSGVGFSQSPLSQNPNELLISAVYGLGEGLVSGTLDSDNYYYTDGELTQTQIATKEQYLTDVNGKTTYQNVDSDLRESPVLSPHQQREIVNLLQQLEQEYGCPQDVEWAYQNDKLYVLQTRPITTLPPRQSGVRTVWDNSNIVESYPGITLPLTYSFIREMYEVVYIQFCQMLGLSEDLLVANEDLFPNMLGHLRGRVYYNLRSWYRALALLPGYRLNAGFMETMMGVKEKFELEQSYQTSKILARWQVFNSVLKMLRLHRQLPRQRRTFLAFLDKTIYKYKQIDYGSLTAHQLMEHYRNFSKILTQQWHPPLVNDFFAMIYFGLFKSTLQKWTGNEQLHNDLLAGSHDIVSTEPMRVPLQMATDIKANTQLTELFQKDATAVWRQLTNGAFPNLKERIDKHLYLFGERCHGELKLETVTYNQEPERFIKIIQTYINSYTLRQNRSDRHGKQLREAAEETLYTALKGKPLKKWVIRFLIKKTRDLVSNRENLRLERTRGFGIVRQIFNAMGSLWSSQNTLEKPADIFYLKKEEIWDYIEGNASDPELKSIVDKRKSIYLEYETDANVPDRVTTYGEPYTNLKFEDEPIVEGDLRGIGCCAGVVRGSVTLVHSPDEVSDLNGSIMIARSTDPGWVPLFPTAAAIIVEKGSLLSHSAIVARELGIPCIVGASGILQTLSTGDEIEMDGSTGAIKIVNQKDQV